MNKFFFMSTCLVTLFCFSCSRKTIPEKSKAPGQPQQPVVTVTQSGKPTDPVIPVVLPKPKTVNITKTPAPKIISVNDAVAKKAVDGRLYYDLEGHRYWRSKKDGKYYKYYKGMSDDPAFKP